MKLPQEITDKILSFTHEPVNIYKKISPHVYWSRVCTSLKASVRCNRIEKVKLFLEKGNNEKYAPCILIACKKQNLDILELLLQNAPKNTDYTHVISYVCRKGDLKLLNFLKEKGVNVQEYWIEAVKVNSLKLLKILTHNLNLTKEQVNEAFQISINNPHLDIIKFVIELGPSEERNYNSDNFLRNCDLKTLKFVIENNFKMKHIGFELNCMIYRQEFDKVKFLLKKGYTPSSTTHVDTVVISHNDLEIVDLLKGKFMDSLIDGCIKQKNIEIFTHLIDENTDIDYILRKAIQHNSSEIVKLLVELGANFEKQSQELLRIALANGDKKLIEALIEYGIDIHYGNEYALIYSVDNNYTSIVKLLIETGANVHISEDYALRKSVRLGNIDIVRILVKAGADIYIYDNFVFRIAIQNCYLDIFIYLVMVSKYIHEKSTDIGNYVITVEEVDGKKRIGYCKK